VNAAVATQIEPAIRARRATDTEKNRDALLRRLCEKCSLDAQDAIITAYGKVDRTCMLSDEYAPLAWIDAALPIADDATTVSAPHAIVMTLQAVRPAKGEKVLICGCKGGLLGAVAMHMVGETGAVLCIDDTPSIAAHAKESIAKMTDLPCPVDVLQRNDITIGMEGEGAWDNAGALEQRYKEAKAAREKEKYAIDKVRQTVAYPLAKMYWNAVNAVERAERYQLALKVHEILLKYYAICCLIEADQQKCRAPAFCHGVANIVRPALGHWLSIIMGSRESLGVTAFGKILSHDLTRTIKHEAVRTALEQLALTTGTAPPDKISLCSFLDLTTQFRNKPEHGTHLSVQEQGETAQLLLDALRIILLESRLCTELDLVYVEDVQFASKAAGLTARVHRCMGTDRQTLTWNLDTPIDSKAVYLLDNAHHEIARLDPMIVYGQGRHKKPDLFIYVNKGQYLTYFDQDRFPAEQLEQRIDDLVNAYAHVSADSRRRDEFETKFMGALQYCASDGRIDGDEMLKLMSMVRAFGLATNDAAGRIYILDKLKSLNLNVSTP
jgi:protein-L-isoaspartate O-methyltransferase